MGEVKADAHEWKRKQICVCGQPPSVHLLYVVMGETYLSMLSQLNHCMVGTGAPSATQVTKCLSPGRWWSVRSLICEGTADRGRNSHESLKALIKNKVERPVWMRGNKSLEEEEVQNITHL